MKRDIIHTNHEVTKRIKAERDSSSLVAETVSVPYEFKKIEIIPEASSSSTLSRIAKKNRVVLI